MARGGQWPSVALSGAQWWSVLICDDVVVSGGQWLSVVVSGGMW